MLYFHENQQHISFTLNDTGYDHQESCPSRIKGLRILFILTGTSNITVNSECYSAEETDLFLINSYDDYRTEMEKGFYFLSLFIPNEFIAQQLNSTIIKRFHSGKLYASKTHETQLASIRQLYADIFRLFYKNQQDTARARKLMSDLLQLLDTSFTIPHTSFWRNNSEQFHIVMATIHQNYHSPLRLHELAEENYFSVSTFSRAFKETTGMSFSDYITTLRLNHAISELKQTDKTITAIAMDNGFPSANAFITAFYRQHGCTPAKYRKQYAKSPKTIADSQFNEEDIFQSLLAFESSTHTIDAEDHQILNFAISTDQPIGTFQPTWKNLLNIGYASDLLTAAVQQTLRTIQEKVKFRYIHFQGLLNDDMMVYYGDDHGQPVLNFGMIDMVLDFVLSIDLIPYLEFGYMPQSLSKYNERHFALGNHICIPNNLDNWLFLIRSLMEHLTERYGKSAVHNWIFAIFSINSSFLGDHNDFDDYCDCYFQTYCLLKHLDPSCTISAPSSYVAEMWKSHYFRNFLSFCQRNNCFPDLFAFYCYPYETLHINDIYDALQSRENPCPDKLSADENFIKHALAFQRRLLKEYGIKEPKIVIEEWNSTLSQRDYSNDCCFKAAYLVKNIVENHNAAAAFGYWPLLDLTKELLPSSMPFQGGYGLFTTQGIPKSSASALILLNKLGNTLLLSAEGCFITSDDSGIQILLYNYCHFDELFRSHFNIGENPNIYDRFVEKRPMEFHLHLSGLPHNTYNLYRYTINQQAGSSYDCWLRMGSPVRLTKEDLHILMRSAEPKCSRESVSTIDTRLTLAAELAPHEVQMLILCE